MLQFLLRVVLFFMGLLFAASLAVAALVLVGRMDGACRLGPPHGRPVKPWVMRFDPRAGFDRFRAAARPAGPSAADMANARARGASARSPVAFADGGAVTDVRARPVSRSD